MPNLKQIFSNLRHGSGGKEPPGPAGPPHFPERRAAERRRSVVSLQERDTRLRFAARAAGFGIYEMDCSSGEAHWSPELRTIAGLPQGNEPMSLARLGDIIHPEDRQRVLEKIFLAHQPDGNGEFEDEHRLVHPDGSVRWVKARGRTFFTGEGQDRRPLGVTGIVMDVTENRIYQQELADSQARLAALINSTTDAIIVLDSDQRIVLFNLAACRMFRCPAEEAIGSAHERFIPERYRAIHRQHVESFLQAGATARAMGQAGTFLGLRADGEEFPIEASISRVLVGGQWQLMVIIRDITERKADEEALRHSREDLELAIRGADIGIWNWDMRTDAMVWSDRCRQLFGIPLDTTMTFDLFLGALAPEERDTATAAVSRALERHEEYNLEHRVRWPDGSLHWVALVGRGHYDDSGDVIGMSGIALDITEKKEIENSVREREELMRLANEAASIGTYDSDLERRRTRLSPELCAIVGLEPCKEINFDQVLEMVHPDDREGLAQAHLRASDPAGDGLIRTEHRIIRPDGEVRWLVWRGRTLFRDTPTGRVAVRNIGACLDITERRRLEDALRQANEELEQRVRERTAEIHQANEELLTRNQELQQFAYIAAHDLQTPLRSIAGFAQLLQKESQGRLGSEADVWVRQMVHHVERMHELIQDLLVYSGVDTPKNPQEQADFNRIFDEVAASLEEPIRETAARVTRDDPLPTVKGDSTQLAQVLRNLIDNALKYRGKETPRIHVAARLQNNEWLFSVQDNGIGIPKKHQERIFEIFRRLHSVQAYPGTGIGLAICRRVLQRHGGRIWVESEPGQGATFFFTLPNGGKAKPGRQGT